MLTGFKEFMLRGNVLDLAVAVVIGGAFQGVVKALVEGLLTPLIAVAVGQPDFAGIVFTVRGNNVLIGTFLNAVFAFAMVGIAVYFFVVAPKNAITARLNLGAAPPDPTTKACSECLSHVPIAAKRCAFCTSVIG